jgi:hypothetical protein
MAQIDRLDFACRPMMVSHFIQSSTNTEIVLIEEAWQGQSIATSWLRLGSILMKKAELHPEIVVTDANKVIAFQIGWKYGQEKRFLQSIQLDFPTEGKYQLKLLSEIELPIAYDKLKIVGQSPQFVLFCCVNIALGYVCTVAIPIIDPPDDEARVELVKMGLRYKTILDNMKGIAKFFIMDSYKS